MRILTKVVAAVLAVSLLGQNMLFAQQTMSEPTPPSLFQLQEQANQDLQTLQDRVNIYHFLASGASIAFIFTLAYALLEKNYAQALEEASAKAIQEKLALAQENEALKKTNANTSKLLTKSRKELKQVNDELNVTRHDFFTEQTQRKALEGKQARIVSGQERQEIRELYMRQMASVQRQLEEANAFIRNVHAFGPNTGVDMSKYAAIYDGGISKKVRAELVEQLQQEAWYKSLPKIEQETFIRAIFNLERGATQYSSKEGALQAAYTILRPYFERSMSKSTKYGLELYRAIFARKNIALMAVLIFGVSAYAENANAQQENQAQIQTANRIDRNFNELFLRATAEQLASLEGNAAAYETIARNAAILHELAGYDQTQLEELNAQLSDMMRKQNVQQAFHNHSSLAH